MYRNAAVGSPSQRNCNGPGRYDLHRVDLSWYETLATGAKRSQPKDVVGGLCAALATEEDYQGRWDWGSADRIGAEGGGGGGRERGGRGGGGGREYQRMGENEGFVGILAGRRGTANIEGWRGGGKGLGQRDRRGVRRYLSWKGSMSCAKSTDASEECASGWYPVSKPTSCLCALHARRGTKLMEDRRS